MIKHASPILSALRGAAVSEDAAVAFLEAQRWGGSHCCPRCGDTSVYMMMSGESRNRDYRWRCRGCKMMYTVRTGTVFAETRLPLRVWVYAFWKACSSKKGISALQLSREMEITHKSALFVLRRIRHGMSQENAPKLTGTLEIDECYVGGRPRNPNMGKRGRGTEKVPVVAIVQRGGEVRYRMMERLTSARLSSVIAANADLSSRVMTDDLHVYRKIARPFAGGHGVVKHSAGEYAIRGTDVHSNTVESVFSLLKRGVMGTWHSVSRKHLPNYLNEFEFRWNTRHDDDGTRVVAAIRGSEGKRLMYRESVDNPPYGAN